MLVTKVNYNSDCKGLMQLEKGIIDRVKVNDYDEILTYLFSCLLLFSFSTISPITSRCQSCNSYREW